MNAAELFRQETNTVQLAPGEFLYREGDKADNMYVLLEGEIEIRIGGYVKTEREGALIGARRWSKTGRALPTLWRSLLAGWRKSTGNGSIFLFRSTRILQGM